MITPKPLQRGDTVALISTAGATSPEKLPLIIKSVEKLGLHVVVGESCKEKYGYFGGSDQLRANDVQMSFENEKIKGIFCICGGFGTAKILPLLNYERIRQHPKVFVGYSDVTALHTVLNERCGFVTYHAPMPGTEFIHPQMDRYSWQSFKKVISTANWSGKSFENPPQIPFQTLVGGKATGMLTGGNLTLLATSIGTPYEMNTENKIIFIEEVNETPRKIHRLLTQLMQGGKLEKAAGFLLGYWTNCVPFQVAESLTLDEIFNDTLVSLKKPIMMNIACGHSLPTMSLPFGVQITIDADKQSIMAN